MPSFIEIGPPVQEKKIFEGFFFFIYGHGGHLGHVTNVNVYAKFGQILSSHSQDNEWKQNFGRTEGQNNGRTELRKDRVNPV